MDNNINLSDPSNPPEVWLVEAIDHYGSAKRNQFASESFVGHIQAGMLAIEIYKAKLERDRAKGWIG